MKGSAITLMLAAALTLGGTALAADDVVYGRQLMTQQELAEHRAKMNSFTSEAERDRYRMEHHQRMQERAKQRGATLPEDAGQQPRPGAGMGYGPGDGKGKGMGRP